MQVPLRKILLIALAVGIVIVLLALKHVPTKPSAATNESAEPPFTTLPTLPQAEPLAEFASASDPLQTLIKQPELRSQVPGFLVRLEKNSPQELAEVLGRAEQLYRQTRQHQSAQLSEQAEHALPPVTFVLHGPEVELFFRDSYSTNSSLVDQAAKLSALGVVDIKVCRTQSRVMGRDVSQLYPFVGTVPFGPSEEASLKAKGFIAF